MKRHNIVNLFRFSREGKFAAVVLVIIMRILPSRCLNSTLHSKSLILTPCRPEARR